MTILAWFGIGIVCVIILITGWCIVVVGDRSDVRIAAMLKEEIEKKKHEQDRKAKAL